jgi:hypothetical protein
MCSLGLFTAIGEVLNILKKLTVWRRGLQRTEEQDKDRMLDNSERRINFPWCQGSSRGYLIHLVSQRRQEGPGIGHKEPKTLMGGI